MQPQLIALSAARSGHITNPPSRSTNAPNKIATGGFAAKFCFCPAPARVLSLFLRLKLFD